MTLTIDHPGHRRTIPLLPAVIGLAVTAVVAAVALQLSGAFAGSNEQAPTAPAIEAPKVNQGPNVGLPTSWATEQAASVGAAVTAVGGPNVDLAPDWISQQAAAEAAEADSAAQGPNVGLPPNWATSEARSGAEAGRQGPNADLAPDWATQQAATLGHD